MASTSPSRHLHPTPVEFEDGLLRRPPNHHGGAFEPAEDESAGDPGAGQGPVGPDEAQIEDVVVSRIPARQVEQPLAIASVAGEQQPEVVDSHLPGEVVAGPGGHGQEGDARVEQDLGGAAQGAVAASDADEVGTFRQRGGDLLRDVGHFAEHDPLSGEDAPQIVGGRLVRTGGGVQEDDAGHKGDGSGRGARVRDRDGDLLS